MNSELNRRRFLLAALSLGVVLTAPASTAFAKDGRDDGGGDDGGDDNSGSGSDNDDNDDDNSGSGSSGSGRDDSDDDDGDSSGTSGGGTSSSSGGSSSGGSGKSGSGKNRSSKSQSGKSGGSHNDANDAAAAVKNGKAVSLRKLMSHMKAQYGGKVLDVKLNRGIFRYSYRVKHLGSNGRLQTLRLDALSLKKL